MQNVSPLRRYGFTTLQIYVLLLGADRLLGKKKEVWSEIRWPHKPGQEKKRCFLKNKKNKSLTGEMDSTVCGWSGVSSLQ